MSTNQGSGIRFLAALPEDGERRLMLAVLMDAVRILRQAGAARIACGRSWVEERQWLESDDHLRPFAFVSICNALGIEAEYVRRCVTKRSAPRLPMNGRRYAAKTEESWARLRHPSRLHVVCNGALGASAATAAAGEDETADDIEPFRVAAAVNFDG